MRRDQRDHATQGEGGDAEGPSLPRSLDDDALGALSEGARFLNSKDSYTKPRADSQQSALVLLRELN
jgi:hypothetical protein